MSYLRKASRLVELVSVAALVAACGNSSTSDNSSGAGGSSAGGAGGAIDSGTDGALDGSTGGAADTGAGGAADTGAGGAADTGAGGAADTGAGGETDTGVDGTADTGAGGDIDTGAGGSIDDGAAACYLPACCDPLPTFAGSGEAGPSCPATLSDHGATTADRTSWTVSATICSNHWDWASVRSLVNPVSNAIDSDVTTRFSTGVAQSTGTQALTLDMKAAIRIDGIKLDVDIDINDIPRTYEVDVSTDGSTWSAVACGTLVSASDIAAMAAASDAAADADDGAAAADDADAGEPVLATDIGFAPTTARYVRIFAIETPLALGVTSWWSVHELYVYVAKPASDAGPDADAHAE